MFVIITAVILLALSLRLAGRAVAPIGAIIRSLMSLVAVGLAALAMLAAFALVVFYSVTNL